MATSSTTVSPRVALTLGIIQFFFLCTWTVYVAFLPQLAGQAGIGRQMVSWILLLDQIIFAVADFAAGAFVDRTLRAARRLAPLVIGLTALSCGAFLLLPFVSARGADLQPVFMALAVVWAVTSSALRAPLLALLGKHASPPQLPWLASLMILGMGVAGAVAPYLATAVKAYDPRLPFAASALALLLATSGVMYAERTLVAAGGGPRAATHGPAAPLFAPGAVAFLCGVVVLALGFQIHSALNSSRQYLRFAPPAELQRLLPMFWVGFNLLMLPLTVLTQRYGGLVLTGAAALFGGAALLLADRSDTLAGLLGAQFAAGGAWGCVMMSAASAAIALGRGGREGVTSGALFAALAIAAAARIALNATGIGGEAWLAAALGWMPPAAWLIGGGLLLLLAAKWDRERISTSA